MIVYFGGDKMLVSILADLSVLMGAVLFFFLSREEKENDELYTRSEVVKFISLVTIVGVLLMRYSVVIEGTRYDYRFLLYASSMKFLGKKITFPSIILITLFRLFWGMDIHMLSSIIYAIIILLTFSFIKKWVSKISSDFIQLVVLSMYTLCIGTVLNLLIYHDIFKDSRIYLILASSSIVMIFIFVWIRNRISAIYEKSEIDYLTNLLNSRRFYIDLARLENSNGNKVIGMLDIDYFKRINDEFGHLAGDEVLRQVSRVFLKFETNQVHFYRIGGEEFACLIQGMSKETAVNFLNTIRQNISEIDTGLSHLNQEVVQVTISIGMSTIDHLNEIHQSLRKSDDALYHSKISGRNRVSVAQAEGFQEIIPK